MALLVAPSSPHETQINNLEQIQTERFSMSFRSFGVRNSVLKWTGPKDVAEAHDH